MGLSLCLQMTRSWWRHQMETFSALLAICAGNSPVPGEFSAQRPVTRRFDVFFYLRLNKRLSKKQSWGWWIETLSHPLWRHRNVPIGTRSPAGTMPTIEISHISFRLHIPFLILHNYWWLTGPHDTCESWLYFPAETKCFCTKWEEGTGP